MKLYIALLALAANSVQVLGAPAEDTQDIAGTFHLDSSPQQPQTLTR